jgi:hypothetical protein
VDHAPSQPLMRPLLSQFQPRLGLATAAGFFGSGSPADRSARLDHPAYLGLAFLIVPTLSAIDAGNPKSQVEIVNARVWCRW